MSETARTTIDQSEVDRFSAMAAEWWDPTGKFRRCTIQSRAPRLYP